MSPLEHFFLIALNYPGTTAIFAAGFMAVGFVIGFALGWIGCLMKWMRPQP